ncbi:MAG: hypothetical protein ACYTG1_10770 [Planctomycetota bacterium]|jgi:hypothetical protein
MPDQQATIRIMCPDLSCRRILAVPADARGKLVRCRRCGMTIRVPQPRAQAAGVADKKEEAA